MMHFATRCLEPQTGGLWEECGGAAAGVLEAYWTVRRATRGSPLCRFACHLGFRMTEWLLSESDAAKEGKFVTGADMGVMIIGV